MISIGTETTIGFLTKVIQKNKTIIRCKKTDTKNEYFMSVKNKLFLKFIC
jgi:hypothetical protein